MSWMAYLAAPVRLLSRVPTPQGLLLKLSTWRENIFPFLFMFLRRFLPASGSGRGSPLKECIAWAVVGPPAFPASLILPPPLWSDDVAGLGGTATPAAAAGLLGIPGLGGGGLGGLPPATLGAGGLGGLGLPGRVPRRPRSRDRSPFFVVSLREARKAVGTPNLLRFLEDERERLLYSCCKARRGSPREQD